MGRPMLEYPEVILLYNSGLSTRAVARELKMSYSFIGKIIKRVGISRTRSIAGQLASPMQPSNHWRTCRAQARKIMARHLNRKLGRLELVHHVDGDFTNNSLHNLEIKTPRQHTIDHYIKKPWRGGLPYNPAPRHTRSHRIVYMKQYNKVSRKIAAMCSECGINFYKDKYNSGTTCSHSCGATANWRKRHAVSS